MVTELLADGFYGNSGFTTPASFRHYSSPSNKYGTIGFRIALYIN